MVYALFPLKKVIQSDLSLITRSKQTECNSQLVTTSPAELLFNREDALPANELSESERQSSQADLAICLGTSLQITPACNIPLRTVKAGNGSGCSLFTFS